METTDRPTILVLSRKEGLIRGALERAVREGSADAKTLLDAFEVLAKGWQDVYREKLNLDQQVRDLRQSLADIEIKIQQSKKAEALSDLELSRLTWIEYNEPKNEYYVWVQPESGEEPFTVGKVYLNDAREAALVTPSWGSVEITLPYLEAIVKLLQTKARNLIKFKW